MKQVARLARCGGAIATAVVAAGRIRMLAAVVAGATLLGVFTPALAGKNAGITARQADEILEELRGIRTLLEKQGAGRVAGAPPAGEPGSAKLSWVDRPALGKADAPVTVIEFTDYACPYCQRFHQATWPGLKRDFVDTGLVRWVVRDMPLPIHPDARMAAQAAHCAGEQGQFWELRPLLYANRSALGREALENYAVTLGLNAGKFRRCLDGDAHLAAIDADTAAASEARITGTPTFLIGRRKGDVVEGRLVIGAQAAPVFDGAIRTELAAAGKPAGQ